MPSRLLVTILLQSQDENECHQITSHLQLLNKVRLSEVVVARENRLKMKTRPAIERTTIAASRPAKRRPKPVAQKATSLNYLQRIAGHLKTLRILNGVGSQSLFISRDEIVRAWTVSYFLPMLKGKDTLRSEPETFLEKGFYEGEQDERPGVRLVAKPKKGLRLPRIFAPCKKFESAR